MSLRVGHADRSGSAARHGKGAAWAGFEHMKNIILTCCSRIYPGGWKLGGFRIKPRPRAWNIVPGFRKSIGPGFLKDSPLKPALLR
jgi:hypothetical protein